MIKKEIIKFENMDILINPDPRHEFLMTTEEVARGYDITPEAIRSHKCRHADELVSGIHYFDTGVANCNSKTLWTKRGVVRLGFFIKSIRALKFRDAVENHVLKNHQQLALPETYSNALRELADSYDKIIFLEDKIKECEPKVLFAEAVWSCKDNISFAYMAYILKQKGANVGRTRLFRDVRNMGRIHQKSTVATQKALEMEIFCVEINICYRKGREYLNYVTKITPKGQEYLIKKYLNKGNGQPLIYKSYIF